MKYIANPVIVDAFRVVEVGAEDVRVGGFSLRNARRSRVLQLENRETVVANEGMLARMTPVVGDYWVIQSDGYIYLNPKAVFERKYSPAHEAHAAQTLTIEERLGALEAKCRS